MAPSAMLSLRSPPRPPCRWLSLRRRRGSHKGRTDLIFVQYLNGTYGGLKKLPENGMLVRHGVSPGRGCARFEDEEIASAVRR